MSVKGELKFDEFIIRYKKAVEEELLALATHLAGLVGKYAPVGGNAHLAGSFEGSAIEIPNGVGVELGSPLEYGAYTEWGTKPHWAPIEPLIEWVEQKLQPHVLAVGINFDTGRALPNKTRKGSKILRGDKRKQAVMALARKVQYKIATKGTRAQFYMAKSLNEMGLRHEMVDTETGRYYAVDIVPWLEPRMPEIIARATKGLSA